jgi:phthiocerol/phenolphthiocerol synthesis type-I polyketide synthase E
VNLPAHFDLTTDVAVVGCAGRFPGARDIRGFFEGLVAGVEQVRALTDAELEMAGVAASDYRHAKYVRRGVTLEAHDCFDAAFFGYTPREAEVMNPAQRLLIEVAHLALEDAGCDPEQFAGRIGAFVGASGHYLIENLISRPDVIRLAGEKTVQFGNDPAFAATHLAYRLKLRGPAIGLQTACSTSLVAVHLACRSLLDFECEAAIAGGANIAGSHGRGYRHREGGILARDGHCRPFDAEASGTISGSGAGAVLLKRLEDALEQGDRILAVIKASAINNDGADKVGFAAPGVDGQREVIAAALERAQIEPGLIAYHETHGTGTSLGDPIEIEALTLAHGSRTRARQYCALGALKANLGHMGTAAGIGGFIKACQVVSSGIIPPLANFRAPNPALRLDAGPFRIPTRVESWPRQDMPRYTSVSAFGMGGTNAHAILCEPPPLLRAASARRLHIWPISAHDERAAATLKQALRTTAAGLGPEERADAALTLTTGRRRGTQRDFLLVPSEGAPLDSARPAPADSARIAMVFPGQGAQFSGMAAQLHASEPAYRAALEECLVKFAPLVEVDLRRVLLATDSNEYPRQAQAVQCGLFACGYSSARLWEHHGVVPQALLGHSIGEYVAACIAGALTLDEAVALVARRATLMDDAPPGVMWALGMPVSALLERGVLGADLDVAAINSPDNCVVSGTEAAVAPLLAQLRAAGIAVTRLRTQHAFHSRAMQECAARFGEFAATLPMRAPRLRWLSNLTGGWITQDEWQSPTYWARHMRHTVQFAAGVECLAAEGFSVLIDAGPGQSMQRLIRSTPRCASWQLLPTSRAVDRPEEDQSTFSHSLATLWSLGAPLPLAARYAGERRTRIALPVTELARTRHWVERAAGAALETTGTAVTSPEPGDWFYLPSWQRSARPSTSLAGNGRWLIAGDDAALLEALVDLVDATTASVTRLETAAAGNAAIAEELARGDCSGTVVLFACCAPGRADEDGGAELAAYLRFIRQYLPLLERPGVRLLCVTRAGACVGDEDLLPGRAMLGAATRVVGKECPKLTARWIDCGAGDARYLARQLFAEAACDDAAVVLRGARRWTPNYLAQQTASQPVEVRPLRTDGYYLVTGGLGGMGLAMAAHLAQRAPVKLVLTGRRQMAPKDEWASAAAGESEAALTIRELLRIESLGAELLVARADVADVSAMESVAREAAARFGSCRGIIHAAGVVGGALLARLDEAALRDALAAKVQGLAVLSSRWSFQDLDFVMLCSSQNALKGGLGRFAYSAANAYLDAFAERAARTADAVVVRSVNWCAWRDVGMAARRLPAGAHQRRAGMLSTEEALQVLDRALASTEPRWCISKLPLSQALSEADSTELPPPAAPIVVQGRPARLRREYATPQGELETFIAQAWSDVIGISPVGRDDDFFELGGSSLMLIQVGMRLQERYAIELSAHEIFATLTVSGLARELAPRLAPVMGGDPAAETSVTELVQALQGVSAAELEKMISQYEQES